MNFGPPPSIKAKMQGWSRLDAAPVTTLGSCGWFGEQAKLPFPVHPHMLRHSTGYKLANDGHDTRSLAHYLGHRNLQSTARYTALAPDRSQDNVRLLCFGSFSHDGTDVVPLRRG
jgi:integrase